MKFAQIISFALTCAALLVGGALFGWSAKGWFGKEAAPVPSRPANIPASALWAGGQDGGVWVNCAKSSERQFECSIYAQSTGVLIEHGVFEVETGLIKPAFYSNGLVALSEARLVRRD
jgi:hypothetical protein